MRKITLLLCIFILNSSALFAKDIIHIVQKGETLYSISRQYNIPLDNILITNNIEDSSKIKAGYSLKIPSQSDISTLTPTTSTTNAAVTEKKEYKIQKGDTLYSVAKQHSVAVNDLLKENNLDSNAVIKIGQIIKIPGSAKTIDSNKTGNKKDDTKFVKSNSGNSSTLDKNSPYYWPVKGDREKLSGKLQGSKISTSIGDKVYSVSSGKVVWEGPYRGFGRVIFIESGSGYVYVYGGNEKTSVAVGDSVKPGSELGNIGLNMHEKKPTMYFAVYKDGKPVDINAAPRS